MKKKHLGFLLFYYCLFLLSCDSKNKSSTELSNFIDSSSKKLDSTVYCEIKLLAIPNLWMNIEDDIRDWKYSNEEAFKKYFNSLKMHEIFESLSVTFSPSYTTDNSNEIKKFESTKTDSIRFVIINPKEKYKNTFEQLTKKNHYRYEILFFTGWLNKIIIFRNEKLKSKFLVLETLKHQAIILVSDRETQIELSKSLYNVYNKLDVLDYYLSYVKIQALKDFDEFYPKLPPAKKDSILRKKNN